MGKVIEFRGPVRRPPHIEIFDGILQSTVLHDAVGRHVHNSDRGRRCFFVDLVEADGSRLGLRDGFDYSDAIRAGAESARDFGVPREDLVGAC
jgi:hypothetical protein